MTLLARKTAQCVTSCIYMYANVGTVYFRCPCNVYLLLSCVQYVLYKSCSELEVCVRRFPRVVAVGAEKWENVVNVLCPGQSNKVGIGWYSCKLIL